MKNLNSLKSQNVEPVYLFITGGGGAGKSHSIKTIYHTVVKNYRHAPMNPGKPTVLLACAASTGAAAINIDGTIINTALAIPKSTGDVLPAMSDQKRIQMKLSLCELKVIIIDEILMVGNTTLLHIHQRQKQIFDIIIHQTHYEKSDWSRAFNQFIIACELDMINVISAADITFIMSSSTSAWLLSPLECSPQKQNG